MSFRKELFRKLFLRDISKCDSGEALCFMPTETDADLFDIDSDFW